MITPPTLRMDALSVAPVQVKDAGKSVNDPPDIFLVVNCHFVKVTMKAARRFPERNFYHTNESPLI